MIIETSAPTRVDLAGGTIDIPPLFLFHEGAATVNFAVDLLAHCNIETRDDDRIFIESVDRGDKFEIALSDLPSLKKEPRLELLSKLVYFFKPTVGFNMVTRSEAPAGAGLAGSSTLNIACIGALNELVGRRYDPEMFIRIAAIPKVAMPHDGSSASTWRNAFSPAVNQNECNIATARKR